MLLKSNKRERQKGKKKINLFYTVQDSFVVFKRKKTGSTNKKKKRGKNVAIYSRNLSIVKEIFIWLAEFIAYSDNRGT